VESGWGWRVPPSPRRVVELSEPRAARDFLHSIYSQIASKTTNGLDWIPMRGGKAALWAFDAGDARNAGQIRAFTDNLMTSKGKRG
jgi:hypothetical protein